MQSLAGDWQVEATVPGGGTYTGLVRARAVGATMELTWEITAGRYFGVGLAEGGAWYVACGEDGRGLGLALVSREGALRWAPARGPGTVGEASAAPLLGGDAWRVPAGSGFPFSRLAILGRGEVREARFLGGGVERGLALPTASGWAVAWYPRFDQTVILRYLPGPEAGTWVGLWGLGGHAEPATELLRPASRGRARRLLPADDER